MANSERQKRIGACRLGAWVVAGFLSAWGVWADVLVLRDGARVETSGAWEVREATVVFRDENGHLRSLQLEQVDLAASRRATTQVRREARLRRRAAREAGAAENAPPSPRPPALVLTDADVEHVDPQAPAGDADGDDGDASAEQEAAAVVVTEWTQQVDPDTGGVTLRGSVRNNSADTVGSLRVLVELYDAEGAQLASTTAAVQPPALTPRASGRFQVRIPGVPELADARFHVDSVALASQEPPPAVVPQRANESRQPTEQPDSP